MGAMGNCTELSSCSTDATTCESFKLEVNDRTGLSPRRPNLQTENFFPIEILLRLNGSKAGVLLPGKQFAFRARVIAGCGCKQSILNGNLTVCGEAKFCI